jgi:hypothetical protein
MMEESISPKKAERKAFETTYQDGLWDVLIGCFILIFAVGPYLTPSLGDFWGSAVFVPFWALVYLAVLLVRKWVVRPRIGEFKFGPWRRAYLLRFNVAMVVVLLVALVLGILSALNIKAVASWAHVARFSLVILILFSVAAFFLNFTRLYIYAALISLSPLVGEWLYARYQVPHHGYPITFGFSAAVSIGWGLIKFFRLLRKTAKAPTDWLEEEAKDA